MASAGDDPLAAALKMTFSGGGNGSYFPAARRVAGNSDLLNQIDQTFYSGPAPTATPKPTPSPTPTKPTSMSLADLYNHFGVERQQPRIAAQPVSPRPQQQQPFDWQHLYGHPEIGGNYA
jgi:hypothetical protein